MCLSTGGFTFPVVVRVIMDRSGYFREIYSQNIPAVERVTALRVLTTKR